jgi:acyl transferase domain-containing protein/acyl-CoA synthetase (AMP-forming)/AMP-acid ligase II/thioesterase domain-containing protein/acyl carrier protein
MNVGRWEFEHARRFPTEIGLIFGERGWTNAKLHARSRRFASALLALGVRPGDRVAIALGNSPELFVTVSGVVIAGAALVMLGDRLSSELHAKIAHCEPRVLVCNSRIAQAIGSACPQATIVVVGEWNSAEAIGFEDLVSHCDPVEECVDVPDSTLVQLCYTSGSTGKPKAVPYTQGEVSRFLDSIAAMVPDRQAPTTVLACAPPTAFASRVVTLRTLGNNRYILLPEFDPEQALAAIDRYGVQQISLLPAMAEQLVACSTRGSFDCSSLRWISIGGSHVPAALVAALKKLAAKGNESPRVTIQYGMTEAGGGIAATSTGGDGVVGHLLPGVTVRIARNNGTDAAAGEVGEIIARTPFSPQGYWRDPEQSAHVFRNGFVHTGDLGYFQEDGQLCLVGRSRDMIIQGGLNVFPGEVIKVIYAIPGVLECAVVGCANQMLGEEVVACIVRTAGAELTESHIRAQCRLALDPGKQPVRILFFDALPKKEGGKVDLQALRRECDVRAKQTHGAKELASNLSLEQVRNIIERELRTILLDELGAQEAMAALDGNVPFGDLGLKSRGAVRLAHALQRVLGIEVPPTLAYSHPTMEAAAQWLLALYSVQHPDLAERNLESGENHPIAIVGMGMRLPGGARTPEEFWDLLWEGRDVVGDAPPERRRDQRSPWRAAFLPDMGDFDAAFFRLAADAPELDPRHRLLLEVCWEAFEDAGMDPTALQGERTGVFLGLSGERYPTRNPLGATLGMAAGRLCHFFDIVGPVLTLDTTCSSSLVAVHQAVESLHRRECDLAIVGSANLLAESGVGNSLGVMSSDGHTRAFDAAAEGFGQGEGCLAIVLKRVDDALRAGDRVYACVTGSAINHDGRSSSLTAPNPQSQVRVITRALEAAGVTPKDVQYVEAHGTGTPLGDPIEVDAIARSFGSERPAPLSLGSVKTNIGHLEAAAGLAGVAKVALAIWHHRLPASQHYTDPNPRIPWAQIPVKVQSSRGAWPEPHRPLIAGVSSFGMSGTNAHAVLSEPPRETALHERPVLSHSDTGCRWLLPISAQTEVALRAAMLRWICALERDEKTATCRDIAYSASCRRAHLPFRVAVVGDSRREWAARLREQLSSATGLLKHAAQRSRKLAVAFSGQGSQWAGMAMDLFAQEPLFRDTLTRCAGLIDASVGGSILDEIRREGGESRLNATQVTQPALFAVQVALYELWTSWGVEPVAVVGHSAGEIAAAHVAGLLTLEEAALLICERGRACGEAPHGGMLAAALSSTEAAELCSQLDAPLEIAAINGPRSVVLSGATHAIQAARKILSDRGVQALVLQGVHAFHSRLMQPAAAALRAAFADPPARTPRLRLISGMTAAPAGHLNSDYWSRQLLEPVRFNGAVQALLREGCTAFLEIGPHPVLLPAIHEAAESVLAVGSLRRGRGGVDPLLDSLGQLYCGNVPIDWRRRFAVPGRYVDLPRYPWEHQRYWHDSTAVRAPAPGETGAAVVAATPEKMLRESLAGLADIPAGDLPDHCSLGDLAIDSLGLIRLGGRLARWTGKPAAVPSPQITLGELIQDLRCAPGSGGGESGAARSSPLCWLRRVGDEPTHVWIHPAGGGVDCYRPLAESLPFRSAAINSPALLTNGAPPASIEELAADYLSHLERAGVSEPVVLGGWSLGGAIAFEMAVQRARQGHRVAQVVLIDSYAGSAVPSPDLLNAAGVPPGVRTDIPAQELEGLRRTWQGHFDALRRYRPGAYRGPVLSVRAVPAQGSPDEIWQAVAGDLQVHRLSADHFSIMSPRSKEALLLALKGSADCEATLAL